jgi:hypothetical protein
MATIPATAFQQEQTVMLQPETTHGGTLVENAAADTVFTHPMFQTEFLDTNSESLYFTNDVTVEQELLNISSTENHGMLVDKGYFSSKTVTGVINYGNLDENSYKEFGFMDPTTVNGSFIERPEDQLLNEVLKISMQEMALTTEREKSSALFFTSENYEWVNGALYNTDELPVDFPNSISPLRDDDFTETMMEEIEPQNVSKTVFADIITNLDNAIGKGPKKQRIVYRGLPNEGTGIKNSNLNSSQYVDTHNKLGQELVFDGYQSSTVDFGIAYEYAGDSSSGIVYEILTPEGINITSTSNYEHEKEVLLPRQARYMVVGVHKNVEVREPDENYFFNMKAHVVQLVAINDNGAILDGTNSTALTSPYGNV